MSTTIKGKNIDTSKLAFSQPRVLDNGAKLVYMNYDGGRLSIQTPWMSLPWKMGVYTEGEYPKYSIDLSFKGMENEPDLQAFHDKLQEVETKIIDAGFNNHIYFGHDCQIDSGRHSHSDIGHYYNIDAGQHSYTGIGHN